jgi:hypothetical protein
MKKITVKGKDYDLRNLGEEVTLNELAKISHILEDPSTDFTEKWLDVLSILGSKELVEVITISKFTEAVQSVTITNIQNEIQPRIEVNGRVYECPIEEGQLDITAKDLSKIEKMAVKGGAWGHKAFALIYKDVELTDTEHYTDAHIEHKAKLFGEAVNADVAAPVIFQLSRIILDHIQQLVDAQSSAVS